MISVWLFSFAAIASSNAKPNVDVGIYVNNIRAISYKNDSYVADITLWFRWDDPKIHPEKTFKIANAKIDSKKEVFNGLIEGTKTRHAIVDVTATIDTKWDIKNFPFDQQRLTIKVEENEDDDTVKMYRVDSNNITTHPIEIPGWKITGERSYVTSNHYDTNFGDPSGDPSVSKSFNSTQFNYEIDIKKKSTLIGFKLLIAPIVAILLMSVVLRLPASESPRMGVATTSLFALVSSSYIITGQLPDSEGFSFAEKLITFGLIQCAIYLTETVASLKYAKSDNPEMSQQIDKRLFWFLMLSNLLFMLYALTIIF